MKRKKPELSFSEIEIIKKIINTRKAFGLSQADLAKRAGVSKGYIAQLEVFYYKPTDEIIKKIALGLNSPDLIKEYKYKIKIYQESLKFDIKRASQVFNLGETIEEYLPGISVEELKDILNTIKNMSRIYNSFLDLDEKIKYLRNKYDLSQKDLAEKLYKDLENEVKNEN
jgi:transcriptional regulator with XRE-family HTH domain